MWFNFSVFFIEYLKLKYDKQDQQGNAAFNPKPEISIYILS
jgi:hypothetical protein